jgi:peptide deformylase
MESGRKRQVGTLDMATSELLQHEIDHLKGVLAIDRALDRDSIVLRET